MAGSVVLTAALLANGHSSRLKGAALVGGYVVVAIAFLLAGDR
jgi:Ca2+/H+ antiporter